MKIAIDKEVITLAEAEAAKKMAKDYGEWLDSDTLESMANRVVREFRNCILKLVKINKVEICKNHYQLTVWAEVILESYDNFIVTYFDVPQANEETEKIDNYTRVYKLV